MFRRVRIPALCFDQFLHQPDHLAGLGVASSLEFGIKQLVVHGDFEPASIGGHESERLDFRFEVRQQFICQADGPVSVVSNSAINDPDF